ncbi:MAG TPA: hypothetical protein VGX28_00640 [Frankiaceae bacterium]|nr:hypothetical protein [Frankiaceae bacterium]
MSPEDADALRCAVHPGLPAYDTCPVCARPRCAADSAAAPGGGCHACRGVRARSGPPPLDGESLVRAGVLCGLVAPLAGIIASEYAGAGGVGIVVPFFVGIVLGILAESAARRRRGRALRILAAIYAVVGVAVGLDYEKALGSAFKLSATAEAFGLFRYPVVPVSYVMAALGAWVWTAPPKAAKKR